MKIRVIAFVVIAAVATFSCARQQPSHAAAAPAFEAPPLWGLLAPEGYAVRLDTLMRRAPAKEGWAAAGRPVQITIWSPANARGTLLTYRDYIALTANQATLAPATPATSAAAVQRLTSLMTANGSSAAAVEEWMNMPIAASWDAPRARGRFPLVIIAQGNYHSAYNQAVLGEYLASHGYVVATSPSPLALEETPDSSSLLTRARRQAADIEYAVAVMQALPDVDATRVGVVAHSFGARAAFVAIADGAPFRAFVSLDGGIGNKLGNDWLAGTPLDSVKLRIPLLHIYQGRDATVQPDLARIRSWHDADRTLVRVDDMYHPYFTALGFVAAVDTALHVAPPVAALATKVGGVVQMTATFLDETLARGARSAGKLPVAGTAPFSVEHLRVGQ
jgi:dienelactone hydrolase